ncbi:MAG: sigma-70 family RNA polymerase sigma factor [Planctomycetes bacterium]|nr:sigma-70 family RNA polymerase sigma factor [Planctomycetota bacterium]
MRRRFCFIYNSEPGSFCRQNCSAWNTFVDEQQQKVLDFLDVSGARLHTLLTRLTLSEETAADLLQDLFLRLLNARGFEKAQDSYAYACRAAMNLAFEHRRKMKIRFRSLGDEDPPENKAPGPAEKMIQAEEAKQLLDILSEMKPLEREVLVLRFLEQESYERIAGRIGKKEPHIRSLCSKAIARLRALLTKENKL